MAITVEIGSAVADIVVPFSSLVVLAGSEMLNRGLERLDCFEIR